MSRQTSVLYGRDNEVIPILLGIHCSVDNPLILDCTHNQGTMWKGLVSNNKSLWEMQYNVIRSDIDSGLNTIDVCSDFSCMPFVNKSIDVIVFDPPHLPTNAASKNSSKIWEQRYGITGTGEGRTGDNISGMFNSFLVEAKRVLKKNGIILAKIADIVHNHRYQWHHVDFINESQGVGMTACDMLIKCDPNAGNLASSKWVNVMHLRKAHCYWIVVRNSNRCEKPSPYLTLP